MDRKTYDEVGDALDAITEAYHTMQEELAALNDRSYLGRLIAVEFESELRADRDAETEAMFTAAGWSEIDFWAECDRRAEIAIRREYDDAVARVAAAAQAVQHG